MKTEILVIDDNADIRFLICNILQEKNYSVRSAANYEQAVKEINNKLPNMAIVDIKLDKGDRDGIDLLKLLVKKDKSLPVIMISGHANVQVAVEAIRLGAYEFVEKPFSSEKLLNYVKRALEVTNIKKEKDKVENKLFHSFDLIGKSPEVLKIKKTIEKLSAAESRILITGQTGTGKELVARKIHKNSSRNKNSFIIFISSVSLSTSSCLLAVVNISIESCLCFIIFLSKATTVSSLISSFSPLDLLAISLSLIAAIMSRRVSIRDLSPSF